MGAPRGGGGGGGGGGEGGGEGGGGGGGGGWDEFSCDEPTQRQSDMLSPEIKKKGLEI